MSSIREQHNPTIIKLLREHDQLPYEHLEQRRNIERQIMFLMSIVKTGELAQTCS